MRMTARLQITTSEARLLITGLDWGDVLKAQLPVHPSHPRALLTLLEGLALWSGAKLTVAIVAEPDCPTWHMSGLFGDELWPSESQLVRYEVADRVRPKRLRGLGDFRKVRSRAQRSA